MGLKKLSSLVVVGLLLAASPSFAADLKKLDDIVPGDTRARVIEIMGRPGNRQLSGSREALQWCKSGVFNNYYGLVVLHDGKVFTIKTANTHGQSGTCGQGFPTIDFETAPDHTIEIRNR